MFTGAVTLLFALVVSLELVRVGMKIPQDGNRTNVYEHAEAMHGHVCRTLCSVCATGARVAQPVPCNSFFWVVRLFGHRHPVVSTRNFYWDGTGWYENSTRWKSCKRVCTRAQLPPARLIFII